jgi:ParB family transcriptional regulator, chromosome partitioning protein
MDHDPPKGALPVSSLTSDPVLNLALDDIDLFVHQSRTQIDEKELVSLSESLKIHGQLQAGVAAFDSGRNRYILICGERRYRALKRIGATTMAVKVIEGELTQARMLEINISENLQRASLNPIERAKAFLRLKQLESITFSEVAERLSVSNAMVSRDISLLDLPASLQERIISGALPASVAAIIVRLDDDDARRELADKYQAGEVTREGVASVVKEKLTGKRSASKSKRIACKHEGISISVTAGKPLTIESVISAIEHLKKQAKALIEANQVGKQPA